MSCTSVKESPELKYLHNQLAIARKEISNLRQQLRNISNVHRKDCETLNKKLEEWQCLSCRKKQEIQTSTSLEISPTRPCFEGAYIGTINTDFPRKRGTPRQPGIVGDMIAKLTLNNNVFTNPSHALDGLGYFSHMWILFCFHQNESTHVRAKVAPPRLNGIRTGVFATRSPHRPCPIGLSLVKIDRIVDNTIFFSGVDMVNGTPVLDIKPYIPQYDNPSLMNLNYHDQDIPNQCETTATEIADSVRDLSINCSDASASSSILDTSVDRVLDGEENNQRENVLGAVASVSCQARLEESFYARASSRMGEREAPDGEEEESPTAMPPVSPLDTISTASLNRDVRVPPWIDSPPVARLVVLFKERAMAQLNQLGPEGQDKLKAIANVLREDPRSAYLRERWSSHCYVFRIADLFVSCKFNDSAHSVTVYQVFRDEVLPESEDVASEASIQHSD